MSIYKQEVNKSLLLGNKITLRKDDIQKLFYKAPKMEIGQVEEVVLQFHDNSYRGRVAYKPRNAKVGKNDPYYQLDYSKDLGNELQKEFYRTMKELKQAANTEYKEYIYLNPNNKGEIELVTSYDKDNFLKDVFLEEEKYNSLCNLLLKKKNIILQGPPGVGKTFMAKRLAYSIMGEKDNNRIRIIQFHQSYSYEDLILGYRPTENGFKLEAGHFYDFCKKAMENEGIPYFFIIDEINRGNLSKIFGELLMLIEKDKRGESMRLVYSDKMFSVPSNIYIIGMMNTADRSLAMLDYALRRRFAFFEVNPGFETEGFKEKIRLAANNKFKRLVECIRNLNCTISEDESLGRGFRIGHSYLCMDRQLKDEDIVEIIEYELIPLIEEYWFDEPSKVIEWTNKLRGTVK